jgi:N-acylneuraminate cytidylyltransferase
MKTKKVLTLIPARGGSKEIPKKNIIDIEGKPLLSYAINASIKSDVDETWVSTEDDEIANIAYLYGSQVIKRPVELSTDDASSESALLHFVNNTDDFDILVFLQATCPFIKSEDINNAIKLMNKYDSVISVSKFDQFLWNGKIPMYNIHNRKRRQNREQTYIETGSMFVTTVENLLKSKNRISKNIGFVEVPKWRSMDIDTQDDLELARSIMRINMERIDGCCR